MVRRLREAIADGEFGIKTAGDVVKLVAGGQLGVEVVAEAQGQFAEEAVHRLGILVGIVPSRERERPRLFHAVFVAQHRAGVVVEVARLVGKRGHVEVPELVADGVAGDVLNPSTGQGGIDDFQGSGVVQIDFLVDPSE